MAIGSSSNRKLATGSAVVAGAIALVAQPASACRNLNFENGTAYLFTEETLNGSMVHLDSVSSRRAQFFGGPENPVCDYQAKLVTATPNYNYEDFSSYHNTCNYFGFVVINWYQWEDMSVPKGSTMHAFWKDDETEDFEKYCMENMNGNDGS